MTTPAKSQPHGHFADPSQRESWRLESVCVICGRPVVKVRASGSHPERWQHAQGRK